MQPTQMTVAYKGQACTRQRFRFFCDGEPDSLNALFLALLWRSGIFVLRLPVTVEFSQSFQAK